MFNYQLAREFLVAAFGVPSGYVVPKQGTWYNPQANADVNYQTDTWCAYSLDGGRPYQAAYYQQPLDGSPPVSTSHIWTEMSMQLVGSKAEYMAQSVIHWPHRSDLRDLLNNNGMVISLKNLGSYTISTFVQDGLNTVLAFNVKVMIQWLNEIQTSQTVLTTVNLPTGYVITTPSGTLIVD